MPIAIIEGHSSQYPWDNWLDGRAWLLRANGADFSCTEMSITSQAYNWAKLFGVAVSTRLVDGGVIVQAYPIGSTWKPNLAAIEPRKIKKALANPR